MNIFYLKIIAIIAMLFDHIVYFFPDLSIALPFHWIGRIAAPIFIFGVVNGLKHTHSKRIYLLRLYLASIMMAIIQVLTQIEMNFFRTLFVIACVGYILESKNKNNSFSKIKSLRCYILYQIIIYTVCIYMIQTSNASTESICFYLIPALSGSILTLEGGLIFVILGIILYFTYDHKKILILSYSIFVILYMILMSTPIIPEVLWRIEFMIPIIGTVLSEVIEIICSGIIGIEPYNIGGNVLTIQYHWIMIFSLPLILSYNRQPGKKIKYFFYIFYPVHILFLWLLANFIII